MDALEYGYNNSCPIHIDIHLFQIFLTLHLKFELQLLSFY